MCLKLLAVLIVLILAGYYVYTRFYCTAEEECDNTPSSACPPPSACKSEGGGEDSLLSGKKFKQSVNFIAETTDKNSYHNWVARFTSMLMASDKEKSAPSSQPLPSSQQQLPSSDSSFRTKDPLTKELGLKTIRKIIKAYGDLNHISQNVFLKTLNDDDIFVDVVYTGYGNSIGFRFRPFHSMFYPNDFHTEES